MASQLFNCKSIDQLLSDSENAEVKLKKSLGWLSLTSLGIGAVIGSGIFTIVGTAIAGQKLEASSILNAPLLTDRSEQDFFRNFLSALFPESCHRPAVFPKGDRLSGEILVARLHMPSVRTADPNP